VAGNHDLSSSSGVSEDLGESVSLWSESPNNETTMNSTSSKLESVNDLSPSVSLSISPPLRSADGLRSMSLHTKARAARTQAILVVGPPG